MSVGGGAGAAPKLTLPKRPRWMWTQSASRKRRKRCLPWASARVSAARSSRAAASENLPWGLVTWGVRRGEMRRCSPGRGGGSCALPARAGSFLVLRVRAGAVAVGCRPRRPYPSHPWGLRPQTPASALNGLVLKRRTGWNAAGLKDYCCGVVRRDRREVACRLVRRQHVDAADVADVLRERGRQEGLHELRRLVLRVHAGAHRDHVGVVVLAAQRRGLLAPGQRRAHALHLVRRDLLAVAGAADDDAEGVRVGRRALCGAEAEGRVVVEGVVDVGAAVHGVVAGLLEPLDEVVLEFEARMVRAEVHAHGPSVTCLFRGSSAGG